METLQQFLTHRAHLTATAPHDLDTQAAATEACQTEPRAGYVAARARNLWGQRMAQHAMYVVPGELDVFLYPAEHAPPDHVAACAAMFTRAVADADPTCPEWVRGWCAALVGTGAAVWKVDRLVPRGARYQRRYPPGRRILSDMPQDIQTLWDSVMVL